jgi:hypothetical protein
MSEYDEKSCMQCIHCEKVGYHHFKNETNYGHCLYHVLGNACGGALHPTVSDDFWCESGFEYNPNWRKDWFVETSDDK